MTKENLFKMFFLIIIIYELFVMARFFQTSFPLETLRPIKDQIRKGRGKGGFIAVYEKSQAMARKEIIP